LLANTPEGNHAGLMFFSDHGTPKGWRNEHGYGCHTFKWVNAEGKFVYIKYHFIAKHGQKQFTQEEATRMCGEDPDYSKRDLWEAIENGEEIEWTANVQVMEPQDADPDKLGFDPFDVTKIWPRSQFPMQEFGRLVLNKNPENFHRDVEQAAFSPGSMVPGIEDSPDPLLQFRMFFYRDAQYHRIGVNLHQIPVNCPFMAKQFAPLNFDGQMRVDANHAGNKQYAPNSFAHKFRPDVAEAPYVVSDNVVSRKSHYWHEGKKSEYDQARELWSRVFTEQQRKNTIKNTGNMLKFVGYADIQVSLLPFSLFSLYLVRDGDGADTQIEEVPRPGVQHRPGLCAGDLRYVAQAGIRVRGGRAVGAGCACVVQGEEVPAVDGEQVDG
jgi:catalase